MRTQTEMYLNKVQAQIEHNQEHMALLRMELYPLEYNKPLTIKQALSLNPTSQHHAYREVKQQALKKMEAITNRLVVKLKKYQLKYNL